MNQTSNIIEKAKQLGLDTGSSMSEADNLRTIASQVGFEEFNSLYDIDELENRLDELLEEQYSNNPENELNNNYQDDRNIRYENNFGEEEFNRTVGNKDYYSNRQEELENQRKEQEQKLEDAKQKKEEALTKKNENNTKENRDSYKEANRDYKNAKDNLRGTRKDIQTNRLDNIKSKMYQANHPLESAKKVMENKAKETASDLGKKATEGAKEVGKKATQATGKAIKSAGSAIINLIKSNPYVAIVIGVIILILLLILILFAAKSNVNDSDLYSCDNISMTSTPLSKSEFVEKVQEYFNNDSSSKGLIFKDSAEDVYEIATNNNINPELVLIRAKAEGFSPGTGYNYWGLGCTNTGGASACQKFDSFKEGVEAFVKNISQYETISDMMKKYAYIGSYWYNPGSSSMGGCYYAEYIKEYMSASRANQVKNICAGPPCSESEKSQCTATNEEDQEAYSKWQVQKMVQFRQDIFGIGADDCEYYNGEYPTEPDNELYANSEFLINESFEEFLAKKNMSVYDFNDMLKSNIEKAGVGTRNGVVTAAVTLIGSLAKEGKKLNYQWGGKYYHIGVNPSWGAKGNTDCDSYGAIYTKSKCLTNYQWISFDCSGFVNWALINGTQNTGVERLTTDVGKPTQIKLSSNNAVCKPGGVLVSKGHIMLVVGVDSANRKYKVAEATGSVIKTGEGGVKLSYKNYDAAGYYCDNLERIYGK